MGDGGEGECQRFQMKVGAVFLRMLASLLLLKGLGIVDGLYSDGAGMRLICA